MLTSFIMAQFTVAPGGYITIKEGSTLKIDMDLNIESIPGSSGYLVDQTVNGDVIITGNISVERYMTADVWHNAASPVSDENSNVYAGTDHVYYYNETIILNDWNFGWIWYSGPLTVFRGYDIYFIATAVTVNYTATGAQTLNTGSYNIGVTKTDPANPEIPAHKGWNLVGNPYPSPVDWLATSGWNKADINDAKYIWDGANDIYTIFIGGGAPIGINGGTRFIPSNQGFWVQAVQDGTFGISNAVRVGDITGTPDYYKIEPVDYPLVSLVASGNNKSDELIIRFIEGTTVGFDKNYDAAKLFSRNINIPQISIKTGNQILALNTLPQIEEDLEVLLNFQCGEAGYYSIKMTDRTNLDAFTTVYLKDDLEQKIVNLTELISYGFYHKPANDKSRFKVYFNPSGDIINNISLDSYFTVYAHKNIITILKNTVKHVSGEIYVYNMFGQPVCRKALSNDHKSSIQVNLPTGYYIASIITDQHVTNSKILIIGTD